MLLEETIYDYVDRFYDLDLEELKQVQRILSRATQEKQFNLDPLPSKMDYVALGNKRAKKVIFDEPANADWEYQLDDDEWEDATPYEVEVETEETITKTWSIEVNKTIDGAFNILDCCAKTPAPVAVAPILGWAHLIQDKLNYPKENDMNNVTVATTQAPDFGFAETRKYLINRLNSVEANKIGEAEVKFLPSTASPKNGKELKAAIANGWLVADVKDDYSFGWNSPIQYLEFRDPTKPHDRDGFTAAVKAIEDGRRNTKDAIMVLPAEESLAALKAYEGTTFH